MSSVIYIIYNTKQTKKKKKFNLDTIFIYLLLLYIYFLILVTLYFNNIYALEYYDVFKYANIILKILNFRYYICNIQINGFVVTILLPNKHYTRIIRFLSSDFFLDHKYLISNYFRMF